MTLEEAIIHAESVANSKCDKCGEEHRQLAEWLKDYQRLLSVIEDIKKEITKEIGLKSNIGDYNDYVRLGLQSALEIIDKHIGKAERNDKE